MFLCFEGGDSSRGVEGRYFADGCLRKRDFFSRKGGGSPRSLCDGLPGGLFCPSALFPGMSAFPWGGGLLAGKVDLSG